MANAIKKNSAVDGAEYNNFIRDFTVYYTKFYNAIKNIVEKDVAKTVMVENVWTDDFAAQYALWFNDEQGVTDGCDRLNKALINMDALFKTTCIAPNNSVVKNLGEKNISSYGMIRKVKNNRSNMYNVLGVKKYRKGNFPRLNLKRKNGWKSVTKAESINSMIKSIENDVKTATNYVEKIESLIRTKMISPNTRCISITGFTGSELKKSIDQTKKSLEIFKTQSAKRAEKAVGEVNTNQSEMHQSVENVSQEN